MSAFELLARTMIVCFVAGSVWGGFIAIATTMISSRISREEEQARR